VPGILGLRMEAEFEGLIHSSPGMLIANEASQVREFIEAREYSMALEALCGILLDENKQVTPELYYRISSLEQQLDGVDPNIVERVKAIVRR
jgi:hypothetical protein